MAMAAKCFLFLALIILCLVCMIKGQGRGTVRLVRNGYTSTSYSSGRVQIYMYRWGYICGTVQFNITEADVICHQLGYSGAMSYSKTSLDTYGVDNSTDFLLNDVDCISNEFLMILQCIYSNYILPACVRNRDEVSVACWSTRIWDNPYPNQVRLSQGLYTSQGLVEVYCNGQWGTVCDDFLGQTEADTVCKQLGYTGAAAYDSLSLRGGSSQPIWLDDVNCLTSYSNCIQDCQSCPSHEQSDCTHSEDVTVECEYGTIISSFTKISTCNYTSDYTTSTPPDIPSSIHNIIIIGVVVVVVGGVLTVAVPLSICACIAVVVASTRRNRRRTAYHAVPTSPPDQPTVAVSTSVNSYEPVNEPFYPTGTHTSDTKPPFYTPGDPTSSPAHLSSDETPAVNPLPTTSNVL